MQIARVVGQAVATVKHASLKGCKLLVVQLLAVDGQPDGEPVLAIDTLGAGSAARVIVSNDGAGARGLIGSKTSPARWFVMGITD
jgi:ethanolamine utilization protein EutN